MSSRCWTLALLAAGATPAVLAAQDPALGRLRARADSLAREWRQAEAMAVMVDSLERERARAGDTISVGALRVVTNPSNLPVRQAAARAWVVLDSLYGSAAGRLAQRPYILRAFDPDTTGQRPALHVGMEVPWDLDAAALATVLVANAPFDRPDPRLANWLGAPLRLERAAHDPAGAYIGLVTAPSQAARACYLGDLAACRDALDLSGSAGVLERWYPSPAEQRALVTRAYRAYFDRGASALDLRACVGGNDAACTELLRSLPPGVLTPPLKTGVRATVVWTARRLGGRETYARLLAAPDAPLAARLAAAAGVGIDSLLAEWRAEVLASRPAPVTLPRWGFWVAAAWVAFFAGCGMRSSRWRVA